MPDQTPQNNTSKPWYLTHKFLYSVIGVLVLVVIVGSALWWQEIKKSNQLSGGCASSKKLTQCAYFVNLPIQDPTQDWKTYTNSQYGIEFKYPGSYTIEDQKNIRLLVFKSDSDSFSMWILDGIFNDVNSVVGQEDDMGFKIDLLPYKIAAAGNETFRAEVEAENIKSTHVYIGLGHQNAETMLMAFNLKKENASLLDQIISTIKIQGQPSTNFMGTVPMDPKNENIAVNIKTGLKTYTNSEFNFQVSFPKGWEYNQFNNNPQALLPSHNALAKSFTFQKGQSHISVLPFGEYQIVKYNAKPRIYDFSIDSYPVEVQLLGTGADPLVNLTISKYLFKQAPKGWVACKDNTIFCSRLEFSAYSLEDLQEGTEIVKSFKFIK